MNPRQLINLLLRPLGYEVVKCDPFDWAFGKVVSRFHRPKFVQIGANDGIRFDSLYFRVTRHRLPGVVIEPLPDAYADLIRDYRFYPEVRPLNIAVHPHLSEARLYPVAPEAMSHYPDWVAGIASFQRAHLEKNGVAIDDIVEETVPCAHLMTILREQDVLDAQILQIDTEGFDGEVIRMMDFQAFRPALIKYEHKNLSRGEKTDIAGLLGRHGYQLREVGGDTVAWRLR